MIKKRLTGSKYSEHSKDQFYKSSIYIADYTELARIDSIHFGKEVQISKTPFSDIDYFTLENQSNLEIEVCVFDDSTSFVSDKKKALKHCECVIFPRNSINKSWCLFLELKYCTKKHKTSYKKNLEKAIIQLYKTRAYYLREGIVLKDNLSYLVIGFPLLEVPFKNFILKQPDIARLKIKHNIVLKINNKISIQDHIKCNI